MAAVITTRTVDPSPTVLVVDLQCDAAYPTGGYPLPASAVKLREIYGVISIGDHPGLDIAYSAGKVKLFGTGSANQASHSELAANSTVVSAATVLRLLVIGH